MDDEEIRRLCEHLAATAELPVDREASRWLGEAEAVACDLVGADLDADVLETRLETVRTLVSEVEDTGHPEADNHVDAARRILRGTE